MAHCPGFDHHRHTMLHVHAFTAALLALACIQSAAAAGIDCRAASSAGERAICADATLRQRDAVLAEAYARARAASPGQGARLRQQQRDWLQARAACGADTACLTAHYEARIAALSMPDKADMDALAALRQAIESARRTDPALPFETALKSLTLEPATPSFANEQDADDTFAPARFPRKQPPGVSNAEWRALLDSGIDGGGENGQASYTLLDLDGDGKRDLVIDSYTGGTGLFQTISVLRQEGGKFVVPGAGPGHKPAPSGDAMDASYLYAVNGRGGNQSGGFIRLRGRVYAVYRDSQYGVDNIYLLRPWHASGQMPRLTIRYHYRLSVPALQARGEQPPTRLAPALHEALETAARQAALRANAPPPPAAAPLCPVAADASDDAREASTRYGPGHYSIETLADVAVHVGSQCHIGQLRDWFGSYDAKDGLMAQLCIRKPEEAALSEEACYTVQGPRTVAGIEAGVGSF